MLGTWFGIGFVDLVVCGLVVTCLWCLGVYNACVFWACTAMWWVLGRGEWGILKKR